MESSIQITHGDQSITLPLIHLRNYPDCPFNYLANFPNDTIPFTDITTNLHTNFSFDTFKIIIEVITNKTHYLDTSAETQNLLKIFNLVDPLIDTIFTTQQENLKIQFNELNPLITIKHTFLTTTYEKYFTYLPMLASKVNVIPIQIIYDKCIKCINIYQGLPIYYVSDHEHYVEPPFVINKIRGQMFVDTVVDRENFNNFRCTIPVMTLDYLFSDNVYSYLHSYIKMLREYHSASCAISHSTIRFKSNLYQDIFTFPDGLDTKLICDIIKSKFSSQVIHMVKPEINHTNACVVYGFLNL